METKNLDSAYEKAAKIVQADIQDKIKNGPTRAYRTGDLYRSVESTVVPISTGESIQVRMNEYGKYTDNGTRYIEAKRFTDAGLKAADAELEELIGRAAVEDILIQFDKEFE